MSLDLRDLAIRTPVVTPIESGHLALYAVEPFIGGVHAHIVDQSQSIRINTVSLIPSFLVETTSTEGFS